MALTKLEEMYRAESFDEAQHPRQDGTLTDAEDEITVRNPVCGDVLHLQSCEQAGRVDDVALLGVGCTISQASASLMTEQI